MISRLLAILPKLYLPILMVMCFVFSWQPLHGMDDFWAHAAIGRWMAQNGRVPDQTLFLWGPGTPVPWIYHSWLSQLIFFKCLDGVDLSTGAMRALLLTFAVALTTFIWLWVLWARRSRITVLTPFLFVIMLWCFSPRIHPRPELFSSLFLLILMTFLLVWTERRDITESSPNGLPDRLALRVAGLFLLFVVWANFHGGVATGLVFIALTIVGEALQDWKEKRSWRPTFMLCGILFLCALAINVNPYGVHYWSSFSDVGSKKFAYIYEWQNIFKDPAMSDEAILITGLIGLLSIIAWFSSPRRRVAHLIWLIFAIVSYVLARRQIAQMAQICLLVMAANAAALETTRFWNLLRPPRKNTNAENSSRPDSEVSKRPANEVSKPPEGVRVVAHVGMLVCLLGMIPGSMQPQFWPFHSLSPKLPVAAAQFIAEKCPDARLLVDYSTSSYLNWRLAGHPPLYIDLINAYPDQLMTDYFDMAHFKPRGLKLLYNLKITHVFINKQVKDGRVAKFYQYISHSPRWKIVYQDRNAIIWQRQDLNPEKTSAKIGP